MPRGKKYNSKQRAGMEYSGNVQQNGLQPHQSVNDLSPKEMASLIKRTGQTDRVDAPADPRHFAGQAGKKPTTPISEETPPRGYYT